jgi:hypothetical protein
MYAKSNRGCFTATGIALNACSFKHSYVDIDSLINDSRWTLRHALLNIIYEEPIIPYLLVIDWKRDCPKGRSITFHPFVPRTLLIHKNGSNTTSSRFTSQISSFFNSERSPPLMETLGRRP